MAVELEEGRTVFVSLKTPDGTNTLASAVTLALAPDIRSGKSSDRPKRFLNAVRELGSRAATGRAAVLPHDAYPLMIWFKDPIDPKSATMLDPDNFAEELGPGARLKRITVEVTTEPVTSGVEKLLPSLGQETGFFAWQESLPSDDPRRRLTRNDFITK